MKFQFGFESAILAVVTPKERPTPGQQSSGTQSSNRSAGMMDNIIRRAVAFRFPRSMSLKQCCPSAHCFTRSGPSAVRSAHRRRCRSDRRHGALGSKLATDTVERQQQQQRRVSAGRRHGRRHNVESGRIAPATAELQPIAGEGRLDGCSRLSFPPSGTSAKVNSQEVAYTFTGVATTCGDA